MEKVCSSKRDADFTSSPPTEVCYVWSFKNPTLFPIDTWPRELGASEAGLILQRAIILASQTHIKMLGLGTLLWHGSIQGVG